MKQPWEWEEEDIEALIHNGVQESLTLEYKRCAMLDKRYPKNKSELSKDVSAFANSAGGTLVYGVEEENHLPKKIDAGYDPTDITREWIEQVINSTIQQRIDGIRIKQIVLNKSNSGKVIYVVYVPQSKRAPHMAEDHVFYKRYNYQSVAMEEYEVRDVSHRNEMPDLFISFHLSNDQKIDLTFSEAEEYSQPMPLIALVQNRSTVPAMYLLIRLYVDTALKVSIEENSRIETSPEEVYLEIEGQTTSVKIFNFNWAVPNKMPIWEGVRFRVTNNPFQLSVPRKQGTYFLLWEILSPGMAATDGIWKLQTTETTAQLIGSPE